MFTIHLPKKYTPVIFVALALLMLIVVSFIYGLDSEIDFVWSNKIDVVTSTEEAIDTSNWKTYRNEEYGFEFKYPDIYKVVEDYGTVAHLYAIEIEEEEKNDDRIFPRINIYYNREVFDPFVVYIDNYGDFVKKYGSLENALATVPVYGYGVENIDGRDIKYLITGQNNLVHKYYINNIGNTRQLVAEIIYRFISVDTANGVLSSIKFIK